MASQWRHKPAILNFETAILNAEPAVKHTQKKDYLLLANEGEK